MNRDGNIDIKMIHRYLAGECTVVEERSVKRWLDADPMNREAMNALKRIWDVQPQKELEEDVRVAWKRLENQIKDTAGNKKKRFDNEKTHLLEKKYKYRLRKSYPSDLRMWFRIAAFIALGVMTSLFFVDFEVKSLSEEQVEEVAMREVATQRGHQSQVTFNDGSKVVLNAESRIEFPERFDKDVREVFLEGEAYFEVEHNPDKAFVVRTSDTRVQVLGTKFNVKARTEDKKVEVAVAQGKVSVQSNIEHSPDDEGEVILFENQMSIVRSGFPPSEPHQIKPINVIGWLAGDFIFDEVPFSEVLNEWERRFDVDFDVVDSDLLTVRFSGEFRREPLDNMLRLASQSLEFNYTREGKNITIEAFEDYPYKVY